MMMSIVVWAQEVVFTHIYISSGVDWDRLGTIGRAPCTRETLPDFRESCRVAQHSRVFRGLTGSQRTPRFLGVTTSMKSMLSKVTILRYRNVSRSIIQGKEGYAPV